MADNNVQDEIPDSDSIQAPLTRKDNPFSEPDDIPSDNAVLDDTHPVTDSNLQTEEDYDEGLSGAAEASEPNQKSDVIEYNPERDQRNNKG